METNLYKQLKLISVCKYTTLGRQIEEWEKHQQLIQEGNRDGHITWTCPHCGAIGKIKNGKWKTTLRERINAHFFCRCKA